MCLDRRRLDRNGTWIDDLRTRRRVWKWLSRRARLLSTSESVLGKGELVATTLVTMAG